jgi:hypothetical protein
MPIGYLPCIQFGWILPALAEGLALQLFFDDLLGYLALSFSSAYIFFNRRFSSSSYFIRFISDASIPPNLVRHL